MSEYHRQQRAALRTDLASFIARVFATLEPNTEYLDNWHIHAMTYQLMRVARGDCKRLIINVPPRSAKSICVTISFIAWLMGHDPTKRVMAISYSADLSRSLAANFSTIVSSAWFQAAFPAFKIAFSRDGELQTTLRGSRFAGSIGGSVMGRGADLIVIDDPIKGLDAALSEAERRRVTEFYDSTLFSRLNDRINGAIVIVMQRLHQDDLVGHVLDKEDWTVLSIPAIAPEDCQYRIGDSASEVHDRREGDILHPGRDTAAWLEAAKLSLGTLNFSAQYQQNPLPADGNVIKRDWIKYVDELPDAFERKIVSWDTASTLGENNDFSVGTVWGAIGQDFYLLHVERGRWESPELRQRMIRIAEVHEVNATLIEDTELGRSMSHDLRRTRKLAPILEQARFDKTARLLAQASRFEAGQVHLPRQAPWLAVYLSELLAFPAGRHDDQVDSTSQALKYLTRMSPLIRERPARLKRPKARYR